MKKSFLISHMNTNDDGNKVTTSEWKDDRFTERESIGKGYKRQPNFCGPECRFM